MKIKNTNGLSPGDLLQLVSKGARFVHFSYTLSLIVYTFRDVSGVYLVRADEKVLSKSMRFNLISLLFGWWGIPWGPRYTWQALRSNLRGGKDVTDEITGVLEGYLLFNEYNKSKV